jgi:hypothetical protein
MATSVNLTLFPPNTVIYVTAMANAALQQTVTVTPPSGTLAQFAGSGEGNVAMPLTARGFLSTGSGQPFFKTGSPAGTYKVQISSSQGAQNVQFSSSTNAWSSGATANVLMVVGEDATDNDFNDSVVLFTWYTPAQ